MFINFTPELRSMAFKVGCAAGRNGLSPETIASLREHLNRIHGRNLEEHTRHVNVLLALVGSGKLSPCGLDAMLDDEDPELLNAAFRDGKKEFGWSGEETPEEAIELAYKAIYGGLQP